MRDISTVTKIINTKTVSNFKIGELVNEITPGKTNDEINKILGDIKSIALERNIEIEKLSKNIHRGH